VLLLVVLELGDGCGGLVLLVVVLPEGLGPEEPLDLPLDALLLENKLELCPELLLD
jgi:hypothetical protein